jgi:hypothetical protein
MLGVIFVLSTCYAHDMVTSSDSDACSPACCAPGVCDEPAAKFKNVLTIKPRQQWNIEGGFCGSISVQVLLMGHGAWVSEDLIRKANIGAQKCFGHNETKDGCEVGPENYAETANGLRLKYDVWDYTQPKPQAKAFKAWLKSNLVRGGTVMWAPMEKGAYPHQPYGPKSTPGGGAFDHHEPIIGIGSNHDLSDATVYDDDWLLHYSNQDLMPYYRRFSSLEDGLHMDGNCQNASTSFPNREAFPCFFDQVTYGLAVSGFNIQVPTLRVQIDVDHQSEPDVRPPSHEKPMLFQATATVRGLAVGQSYVLYRYSGFNSFPAKDFEHGYDHKLPFVASRSTFTYKDPNPFLSNGAVYYIAALASAHELAI